ncbi:MAG: hypothetical protein BWK79_14755 [Beggiatoa sp. IS2]|nr:MAG: hypothetical protein BWK79_14755 [Beggiatoa sp. IS2]
MKLTPLQQTVLGLFLIISTLYGCATTAHNPPDPFEKFNRGVFAFNESVDKALLKPVAQTYKAITPKAVDKGVTNFFGNISDVVTIVNDLLQLKFNQAILDSGRVFINSTVGLLGLVDLATEFGLPKHSEDFGQTLGHWGIHSGPYLVLPLLGPSSVRDLSGRSVDIFFDPRTYLKDEGVRDFFFSTMGIYIVDVRADLLDMEQIIEAAALDKYTYIRDAYLRQREYMVYDGHPPQVNSADEDDLFKDLEEESQNTVPQEESPATDRRKSEPALGSPLFEKEETTP